MSNNPKPNREPKVEHKLLLWKNGIKQKEIAKRTGYTESYVSYVLSGDRSGPGAEAILSEIEAVASV